MTWTRLDDAWTDRADLAELSAEDRWHYLAMIQLCSRSDRIDGIMRVADARRCSDHPAPGDAISRLVSMGLLKIIDGGKVKVVQIDEHIPPPSVRNKAEQDRIRKRRERAHKADDHSLCLPENCEEAGVTPPVTSDVTRDPGTGQDRPGLSDSTSVDQDGWKEVQPGVWEEPDPWDNVTVAAPGQGRKSA